MSADNQQERPNYRLHAKVEVWDHGDSDSSVCNIDFYASNDDSACKRAIEIKQEAERDNAERYKRSPETTFRGYQMTPLKLERISYVIKEVEETIRVSLQGDARDRAGKALLA